MNNIEPVEKVNGIARNRKVGYHHNEDDPRGFLEMFKRKVEKAEKTLEEQLVEKPQKTTTSEIILIKRKILRYRTSNLHIYRMESKRLKNFKIYNRLNAKSKDEIIPEHKPNTKLNINKMMNAYNKSPKKIEKIEKTKKVEEPKQEKQKPVKAKTKKEEMKEFKQEIKQQKQEEKTPLDKACDEFDRAQRAGIIKARKMRTLGYRGYDKQDYRDYR